MPVWIHQSLTHYHKRFTCGYFLSEGQKNGPGYGDISIQEKKGSRILSSRVRGKISGVRGVWVGWGLIWGGITSKFVIKCVCWGSWGYWGNSGWVFLGNMGLSVRSGIFVLGSFWGGWVFLLEKGLCILGWIGMDFIVLYSRNWLWGHWQNYGRLVGVTFRGSGSGILGWGWIVYSWGEAFESYRFALFRSEKFYFMCCLVECEKLACYWMDIPEKLDGKGSGWDGGTIGIGHRIGISVVGSWCVEDSRKWCLPPLLSVLQGVRSICVSAENNHKILHTNLNCNIVQYKTKITYDTIVLWNT